MKASAGDASDCRYILIPVCAPFTSPAADNGKLTILQTVHSAMAGTANTAHRAAANVIVISECRVMASPLSIRETIVETLVKLEFSVVFAGHNCVIVVL